MGDWSVKDALARANKLAANRRAKDAGAEPERPDGTTIHDELDRGLRFIIANWGRRDDSDPNDAGHACDALSRAVVHWERLAAQLEAHYGYPDGYIALEVHAATAWLGGHPAPDLWLSTEEKGRWVLGLDDDPHFTLPFTSTLDGGKQVRVVVCRAAGDHPDDVWDIFDLLRVYRIAREFDGAYAVGELTTQQERIDTARATQQSMVADLGDGAMKQL